MLLERVAFNPQTDELWCVGDIVARGPDSLAALRFFAEAPTSVKTVLGNHDLNLMAILLGKRKANPNDKLDAILQSPQRLDWLDWLRQQPLLHIKEDRKLIISHAGFYPHWTLNDARTGALDVQQILRGENFATFISAMFGNQPDYWHSSISGFDRYRFIVNALTRMRYCTSEGKLVFSEKGHPRDHQNDALQPWFAQYNQPYWVAFGHWAALMGDTSNERVIGLDTGCVWGNHMTLWDVDNHVFYQQSAVR